ncbi:hypothetical protein J542_3817 [Acinetobacter baumannii 299505]|nr:hypothetical protein J542_3817 [Acinetobacter baumannii 299505]
MEQPIRDNIPINNKILLILSNIYFSPVRDFFSSQNLSNF